VYTQANAAPVPNPAPAPAKWQAPERHPELRKAMHALQNARTFLQNADRDFGGHRTKAVEACDRAIKEIHEAFKFDKK
jgi:hypothetical protein